MNLSKIFTATLFTINLEVSYSTEELLMNLLYPYYGILHSHHNVT